MTAAKRLIPLLLAATVVTLLSSFAFLSSSTSYTYSPAPNVVQPSRQGAGLGGRLLFGIDMDPITNRHRYFVPSKISSDDAGATDNARAVAKMSQRASWKTCMMFTCIPAGDDRCDLPDMELSHPECCSSMLYRAAKELTAYMHTHGMRHYLGFGSALGVYRSNSIIPWTSDLDIVVSSSAFAMLQSDTHRDRLKLMGYDFFMDEIGRMCFNEHFAPAYNRRDETIQTDNRWGSRHKGDLIPYVDIYYEVVNRQCNKVSVPFASFCQFPIEVIYPLQVGYVSRTDVLLPNNLRAFLHMCYGKEYMTPLSSKAKHGIGHQCVMPTEQEVALGAAEVLESRWHAGDRLWNRTDEALLVRAFGFDRLSFGENGESEEKEKEENGATATRNVDLDLDSLPKRLPSHRDLLMTGKSENMHRERYVTCARFHCTIPSTTCSDLSDGLLFETTEILLQHNVFHYLSFGTAAGLFLAQQSKDASFWRENRGTDYRMSTLNVDAVLYENLPIYTAAFKERHLQLFLEPDMGKKGMFQVCFRPTHPLVKDRLSDKVMVIDSPNMLGTGKHYRDVLPVVTLFPEYYNTFSHKGRIYVPDVEHACEVPEAAVFPLAFADAPVEFTSLARSKLKPNFGGVGSASDTSANPTANAMNRYLVPRDLAAYVAAHFPGITEFETIPYLPLTNEGCNRTFEEPFFPGQVLPIPLLRQNNWDSDHVGHVELHDQRSLSWKDCLKMTCNWDPKECEAKGRTGEISNPKCCTNLLKQHLVDLIPFFKRHGIHHYAAFGTALGPFRTGNIIPWTADTDLAISAEGLTRLLQDDLFNELFAMGYTVFVEGIGRMCYNENHPLASLFRNDSIVIGDQWNWNHYADTHPYVDLYPEVLEQDGDEGNWRVKLPLGTRCDFELETIYPLTARLASGVVLPMPNKMARFLHKCYGEDFRTPIDSKSKHGVGHICRVIDTPEPEKEKEKENPSGKSKPLRDPKLLPVPSLANNLWEQNEKRRKLQELTKQSWSTCPPLVCLRDEMHCPRAGNVEERDERCCVVILEKILVDVTDLLWREKLDHFVMFGSLLGGYRAHHIIAHTADVDIVAGDETFVRLLTDLREELWEMGYSVFKDDIGRICLNDKHPLATKLFDSNVRFGSQWGLNHPGDYIPYMDIYPQRRELEQRNGKAVGVIGFPFGSRCKFLHSDIYPLRELDIGGVNHAAPRNIEKLLVMMYGENFMVPTSNPHGTGGHRCVYRDGIQEAF